MSSKHILILEFVDIYTRKSCVCRCNQCTVGERLVSSDQALMVFRVFAARTSV